MRRVGKWVLRAINAASTAQWLWSIGGGGVVTAIVSAFLNVPWPWNVVLALSCFLLAAALILTLLESQAPRASVHAVSDELGRIIEDGQALKESPFDDDRPAYYEVKNWWDSAAVFVEAVFGKTERDTFVHGPSPKDVPPFQNNYNPEIEAYCDRLRDLARKLDKHPEKVRVSRQKLRKLSEEQQRAAAGGPAAALEEGEREEEPPQEQPDEPEESSTDSPPEPDPPPPVSDTPEEQAVSADPPSDLKGELERQRVYGRRILEGLDPMSAVRLFNEYQRLPKPGDVEAWKVNVEHLLRDRQELLSLFSFEPPEPRKDAAMEALLDGFRNGPERRRIKHLLGQLDRVIERV